MVSGADSGAVKGSRVAGYRLEEQIGQGGMGVVFRARDERLGRPVALKILAPALADDAAFRERFTREWRAAASIDHPHIVPVFAAGEADGLLYIATRFVAGGDAQWLLRREGPLPPERVMAIVSPVASALDASHRAGLLHRDVKPSNMLMDVLPGRPDHVYLSDFGISRTVASTSGVTRVGAAVGTLDYMSPEQIEGRPADGRADQYALACSAFELLTGAPPFRRDEPGAVMFAHMSQPPPPLTSRRAGLPAAADGVMSRALAKAPGERYASCGEFADALRGAFGLRPYRPGAVGWGDRAAAATDPGTRDGPATVTSVPGVADLGQAAGPGGGGSWWRRRVVALAVVVAAVVLVAVVVAATGLLAGGGSGGAAAVPIAVKSALPAVSGDVYVVYLGGQQASAEIYGQIGKAANGEVARLYAQQFPYRNAPDDVGSVILHPAGTGASYEFQVTPTIATRYRVSLFRSGTASDPLATSSIAVIYVTVDKISTETQKCGRPVCQETLQLTALVPPSALPTEISKPWYVYFTVNRAPKIEPAIPKWLVLGAGNGHASASYRISADEFGDTVTFSFQIGNDAYHWAWRECIMNTEAADGIGLPGRHGCGGERILQSESAYVG